TSLKYLNYFLGSRKIINPKDTKEASYCDGYIQWGIIPTQRKKILNKLMQNFGKQPFIIEDGFIRSLGIGLTKEEALSITLSGDTAYYDCKKISNFEKCLNSNEIFSDKNISDAKKAISFITNNFISKYNDAKFLYQTIGKHNSKVLVIDQRFGDASVEYGGASKEDFDIMLNDAVNDNPKSDIIIKRHPDAVKANKGSYFSDDYIENYQNKDRLILIDYDVHPHELIMMCDKIYVVTSGLGFEALMYNKEVLCYGIPYYSGWGITIDKKKLSRRSKKRNLYEIFYVAYIKYSRYYSPKLNSQCTIFELMDYIVKERKKRYDF
ncbi:capsular polysaccharide export protein, LipB/KpsS family, partial [Campylobacter volucris]|nr:hypothetical protein [Campylobacter volucris]